jgi:hypothetical protein
MTVDWQRLDAILDQLVPAMIEVRRHLHAHPGERKGVRNLFRSEKILTPFLSCHLFSLRVT